MILIRFAVPTQYSYSSESHRPHPSCLRQTISVLSKQLGCLPTTRLLSGVDEYTTSRNDERFTKSHYLVQQYVCIHVSPLPLHSPHSLVCFSDESTLHPAPAPARPSHVLKATTSASSARSCTSPRRAGRERWRARSSTTSRRRGCARCARHRRTPSSLRPRRSRVSRTTLTTASAPTR